MKGIIFNLLEEVVTQHLGAHVWDQLLEAAQLDGVFTSLGNYPDEQLMKLVMAASSALNQSPQEVVLWFGAQALPLLARRYPSLFTPHQSTRPFILTLNSIIHPEVRKLYPGADVPDFDFDTSSPEKLVMTYSSRRKLCALAEGLITGAAEHYAETVTISHTRCMHHGDTSCLLELAFQKKSPER